MNYKTNLVHADLGAGAAARIRLAARLAQGLAQGLAQDADAHLIGCATTRISRVLAPEPRCAALRRDAEAAPARFGRVAGEEARAGCKARLVEDETGDGAALAARYCDPRAMTLPVLSAH